MVYVLALRMIFFDDPWHRLWNDVLGAAKDTGFYATILITCVACNLSWGPWQGERWHIELAEGAKDWLRYGDAVLFILEKFLPRWLRDKGQSGSAELAKQNLSQMQDDVKTADYLTKKGVKVAIARWFSWMAAMAWWSQQWTCRLVIMVHLGIKLGFITEKNRQCILAGVTLKGPVQPASGDCSSCQDTMAQSKKEIDKLRDKCVNSLHVATMIHADETHPYREDVVVCDGTIARLVF